MRHPSFMRGEGELGAVIGLALLGLMIYGGYALATQASGSEQEGTVDYSDCRQVVNLKEGSSGTFMKKFTCALSKTTDGKIISGTCVHVDLASDGKCDTAYVYDKKPDVTCPDANAHVTVDDKCDCNVGYTMQNGSCIDSNTYCQNKYGANSETNYINGGCTCSTGYLMKNGQCISYTQDCQNTFGLNSYGTGADYETGGSSCYCDSGYMWNSDRTSCISIYDNTGY